MEHRWGRRVPLDIPVRLIGEPHAPVLGRMENVSVSGAFIQVADREPLSVRLEVEVILPDRSRQKAERVTAYVTRRNGTGVGIEWRDLAPAAVRVLLTAPVRRAARTRSIRTTDDARSAVEAHLETLTGAPPGSDCTRMRRQP